MLSNILVNMSQENVRQITGALLSRLQLLPITAVLQSPRRIWVPLVAAATSSIIYVR